MGHKLIKYLVAKGEPWPVLGQCGRCHHSRQWAKRVLCWHLCTSMLLLPGTQPGVGLEVRSWKEGPAQVWEEINTTAVAFAESFRQGGVAAKDSVFVPHQKASMVTADTHASTPLPPWLVRTGKLSHKHVLRSLRAGWWRQLCPVDLQCFWKKKCCASSFDWDEQPQLSLAWLAQLLADKYYNGTMRSQNEVQGPSTS